MDKARRLLGYDPAVSFEEGLERTSAWGQSRRGWIITPSIDLMFS